MDLPWSSCPCSAGGGGLQLIPSVFTSAASKRERLEKMYTPIYCDEVVSAERDWKRFTAVEQTISAEHQFSVHFQGLLAFEALQKKLEIKSNLALPEAAAKPYQTEANLTLKWPYFTLL